MFPGPRLSFACELDPARLAALFADAAVIDDLPALDARVALMYSDFSDERAGVVRRLNAAGVPVTGIPLLPLADGYYLTADNTGQAARSYQEFTAWTRRNDFWPWRVSCSPPKLGVCPSMASVKPSAGLPSVWVALAWECWPLAGSSHRCSGSCTAGPVVGSR
jgi:hypothetical protein